MFVKIYFIATIVLRTGARFFACIRDGRDRPGAIAEDGSKTPIRRGLGVVSLLIPP